MDNWMRLPNNAGKTMSIHVLPLMVSYAFPKAFTPQSIMAGFKCTGIYPFDPNVFTEVHFMPATVSDRPLVPFPEDPRMTLDNPSSNDPQASTSGESSGTSSVAMEVPVGRRIVSPEVVRPFPRAAPRDPNKPRRKSEKSAIYTDTPEKARILEASKTIKPKCSAARKLNSATDPKDIKRMKSKKPKIVVTSSSDDSDNDTVARLQRKLDESDDMVEYFDAVDDNSC